MVKSQAEYEHRVVARNRDGTIASSTEATDNSRLAGERFRAVRQHLPGWPGIGSVELQRRPVNPSEWESVEIARNTRESS